MSSNAGSATMRKTDDGKGPTDPSRQNIPVGQSYAHALAKSVKEQTNQGKERNTKANSEIQKMSLEEYPNSTDEKMPGTTMVTPTMYKTGVHNPYKLKRSTKQNSDRMKSIKDLIKLTTGYMDTIMSQEPTTSTEEWYKIWTMWTRKGIKDENINIAQLAAIVNFPSTKYKSIKAIGIHMLEKITVLSKFIVIPNLTRDQDPIVRHTQPILAVKHQNKQVTEIRAKVYTMEKGEKAKSNEKKGEESNITDITPTMANKKSTNREIAENEKGTMSNNPFSLLSVDEDEKSSILGSSIEEITDDGSENIAKKLNFTNNTPNELVKITDAMDLALVEIDAEDEVLKNLKETEISFDKQYDEITTSIGSGDMNVQNTYDHIENMIIDKVSEAETKIMEKMKAVGKNIVTNTDIDEYIRGKLNEMKSEYDKKIESMHEMYEAIKHESEDVKKTITNNRDMINEMVTNGIDQLDMVGKTTNDQLKKKSDAIIKDHNDQFDTEMKKWKIVKNEMSKAHSKLVDTNRVVLKNNEILRTKLVKAESTIQHQENTINQQKEEVRNLDVKIKSLENRTKDIVSDATKELMETVFETEMAKHTKVLEHKMETVMKSSIKNDSKDNDLRNLSEMIQQLSNRCDDMENKVNDDAEKKHNIPSQSQSQTEYQEYDIFEKPKASPMFMDTYGINMDSKDKHPILTPFQFLYPSTNHNPKEIESYKFQKAKLSVSCSSEDNVFTFYNTLRHLAGSFNILLRPLTEITRENGVCQITPKNCINFESARDAMSTALHMKLTTNNYFDGFPQAQTYVQAATNNSDGFRLLYRIVEIIHPQLRASKGGIHKSIEAPKYNDVEDDSIYTFINRYKNYLLYELLSPEQRSYNKKEQALYIVNALRTDDRFKPGVEYVDATLLSYQREIRVNKAASFPFDLDMDEIGVTIDERSPNYTVGESQTRTPTVTQGLIRAMTAKKGTKWTHNTNVKETSEKLCKVCFGSGHCISNEDDICYNLAKVHMCTKFIADEKNEKEVKQNTYRYRKERLRKAKDRKRSNRLKSIIKKLSISEHDDTNVNPIVNLTQALISNDDSDSDTSISKDSFQSE